MNSEFRTKWLQFASFVHCSRQVDYLRAELAADGRVNFVFNDPEDLASDLEFQYSQGAEVPAAELFASLNFLRRELNSFKSQNLENQNGHAHSHR